jgi:hypothetical protein
MNRAAPVNRVAPVITQIQHFGAARNVLLGAGLAYAISEEKYFQAPIAFIFPSIYVGYQTYKNREAIASFAAKQIKNPMH